MFKGFKLYCKSMITNVKSFGVSNQKNTRADIANLMMAKTSVKIHHKHIVQWLRSNLQHRLRLISTYSLSAFLCSSLMWVSMLRSRALRWAFFTSPGAWWAMSNNLCSSCDLRETCRIYYENTKHEHMHLPDILMNHKSFGFSVINNQYSHIKKQGLKKEASTNRPYQYTPNLHIF